MKRKSNIIKLILVIFAILSYVYSFAAFCEDPENIFILEPFIIYENAYNEQKLNYVDTNIKNLFDTSASVYASDILSKSGLKPLNIGMLNTEQKNTIDKAYNILQQNSEELVKQWKDKSRFTKEFDLIKTVCKADALLIQLVKVKVGSPGGWDFMFTGAVIPDSSTTSIKIVLLNLNTGKTYWANSAIERTMPDNSNIIKRLFESLYSNFPGYNKKEERI